MILKNTAREGLQKLIKHIDSLKKQDVYVGVTKQTNARPDGTSNAVIGRAHEFGLKVPERSWLRSTIMENGDKYAKLFSDGIMDVVSQDKPIDIIYNNIGQVASNDVKLKIVNGPFTPLAQVTIDRKGSSRPLIDDGHFRKSITWEVR